MPRRKSPQPLVLLSASEKKALGDRSKDEIALVSYEDVLGQQVDVSLLETDLVLLPPDLLSAPNVSSPLDLIGNWIRGCSDRLERLTLVYDSPPVAPEGPIEWTDLSSCHRLAHLLSRVDTRFTLAFRSPTVAREAVVIRDPDGDHVLGPLGARIVLQFEDVMASSGKTPDLPSITAHGERTKSPVALRWNSTEFELRVIPRRLLALLAPDPLPIALTPTRRVVLRLIQTREQNAVQINDDVIPLSPAESETLEKLLESRRGKRIMAQAATGRVAGDDAAMRKRRSRLNATLRAARWPILSTRTRVWDFDRAFSVKELPPQK